ncbi:hypothetical protein [Longispora albida]|uniref:hypothetical protein n=1 Tax=Longispora albida TaxID=203523 RepID=UPI0003702011|nr:hypothetical protein [Longispora albida]
MTTLVPACWQAVRPQTPQQRFLYWAGWLLVASGLPHLLLATVDGSWAGPVSWRKPAIFGLSFGLTLLSAAWVQRGLPERRWGWIPVGLLGGGSVFEVALITMQAWRGVPSHFNPGPGFDVIVWGLMAQTVFAVVLALIVQLVRVAVQFRGSAAARAGAAAGLLVTLAAGKIGADLAALGEQVVTATGGVPHEVVIGTEGSGRLAHAVGLHGFQVLAALAILLELGTLTARGRLGTMLLGIAGYGALFAGVSVTAYAGRPWTEPGLPIGALSVAGVVVLLVAGGVTVRALRTATRQEHASVVG